ncbi:MAG: Sporulation initiation factor Spo0A C terminal [Bacteriophage sp.]|nr:MAG: Sporulation initiation factor Spo0A C terminal [Bacteriophage sp.]
MGYYKIDEKLLDKQFEFKEGSRGYGQMYYDINKMLLKLQFNVSTIGFYYWITAIQQYRKNYYKYNNTIEQVYYDVAKIHYTTRTRVERAMRTARQTATEEIQKQFNYYNKLTNKTVLELLTRNALFIEKLDNHIPRID